MTGRDGSILPHDRGHPFRILPCGDQETERLGEPDQECRGDGERQDAADPEDRLPAEIGQDVRIGKSAGCSAQRECRPDQARHHGAAAARRKLRGKRQKAGRRAAEPDAGREANGQQRLIGGRERRRHGEDAEDDGRKHKHALAAEPVTERAERQGADRRAEQRGGEQRSERGARELEVVGDDRRGNGDRLRVGAVEKRDQGTKADRKHLERADRPVVDHAVDVDYVAVSVSHGAVLLVLVFVSAPRTVSINAAASASAPRHATCWSGRISASGAS